MKKILSGFLLIVLIIPGCASRQKTKDPVLTQSTQGAPGSASGEVAIGEQIHQQITSSFHVYTEPRMVNYLNKVGSSLSPFAERQDLPYRFTLLYSEKIYATSAPGGYIYLTTGMINFLDNEAELAAVIAHEIGQLQYHDPRLSRARKVLEAITRTGATVGPAFGQIGALAAIGLVMVNALVDKQHAKTPADRIQESDNRALHYMIEAGYDPQGMIDLLYKFLNANDAVIPYFYDYYQSHPITEERFHRVQDEFSKLPLQDKTFSTKHELYMEITKGVREIYKQ